MGGHSAERTHRGNTKFPGMTITTALINALMKASKDTPDRAAVSLRSKVTKLLTENGQVIGLEYVKGGKTFQEHGPVILCTGGYGADVGTPDSLLSKYRSDIKHFPTSNGPHCTGDGIKIS
jgi:succinate dehydrogenase/fumarate reductase flavoprotein subunit